MAANYGSDPRPASPSFHNHRDSYHSKGHLLLLVLVFVVESNIPLVVVGVPDLGKTDDDLLSRSWWQRRADDDRVPALEREKTLHT